MQLKCIFQCGQTYAGTVAAVRRSKEPSPDFLAWLGLGVVW